MKRAQGKHITLLILSIASMGVLGAGFRYAQRFFTDVEEYTYAIDARISMPMRSALEHAFAHQDELKQVTPAQLADFLQKNFSCFKSCCLQRIRPHTVHIEVQAADPLYLINDTSVLTSSGTIIAASCYAPHTCALLPRMSSAKKLCADDALLMAKIPHTLVRAYEVLWKNEHEIWLHNAMHEHFSIVCSIDALPEKSILQACNEIRDQIAVRAANTRGKGKKDWIADVRFDKQIILFPMQEGVSHG